MQWIEIKIAFTSNDTALAVDLVADAFYSLGAKGVVIDDPLMTPEEDWAPDAVTRPSRPAVTGYLPADGRFEDHRHTLEQALAGFTGDHLTDQRIDYQPIDEQDWAESWKAYFKPQKITSRIVVKPTWRQYQPEPGQLVVEIDPGMAFGTGTHPTTCLCIHLLEEHIKPGDTVLDVGTGSGILLITAAKLGAGHMTGIDSDTVAVEVAQKNMKQNHIAPSAVELIRGNLVQNVNGAYDVVVANILAEVIIELLDDVADVVRPGGHFICSGIIQALQTGVIEKMGRSGFEMTDRRQEGDWVALVGRRAPF